MTNQSDTDSGAFVCLLLGGAAIALSPIFIRLADVGPLASAFWRAGLAAPVLLLWVSWEWHRLARAGVRSPVGANIHRQLPLWLAGLFFAGDLAFWHLSVAYTSVANATLLSNLAPVFVTLGAWLVFRQRVSRAFLGAMLLAFAGAAILVGPDFRHGGTALYGDLLGLVTAVFYGAYMLAVKQARSTFSTAMVMAASTAITALCLLPVALSEATGLWPASTRGWLVLIALALIPQVIGQSLIAYAMARLSASLSSVSLLIQPLLATIYASIILGEGIAATQIAGGAVVLTGIWLARRAALRPTGGSD